MSEQRLPQRPDLDQLRRLAKELRDAARAGDPTAAERVARHVAAPRSPLPLAEAQLVVAREHGFPSWARLKAAVLAASASLHDAVEANDVALVRLLLERGAEPDRHVVEHAAWHTDHQCLRLLIEHGAQVRGTGAMSDLIGRDDPQGVRMLIAAGADPGRPNPAGSAPAGLLSDLTENPLPAAARRDSAAVVEALLEGGADPDGTSRDGRSALRGAVRRGRPEVAAVLLRHGARDDVEAVDRLLGACARADRAAAEALLARHPDLVARLGDDDGALLVDLAESGDAVSVRLMLDLGFPPDTRRGPDGGAALHAAAYMGRADVVRLLIAHGADVECRDRRWRSTPLCWATVGSGERPPGRHPADWPATVLALLETGASIGDAWVETKPPSEEVAALLRSRGVDGPPQEQPSPTVDPALLGRVAEGLRLAYETGDLELMRSLLDPDVRWGGGPRSCWNRGQVLEWLGVLRDRIGPTPVREVLARGDTVELRLDVPGLGQRSQAFRVEGTAVVEIQGPGL
jgi:ankyrin repeat protein